MPQAFYDVTTAVQIKGQQVERHQYAGKRFLAMTKIMLQMITVVLQYVKCFIFYFPASPGAPDQLCDVAGILCQTGYKAGLESIFYAFSKIRTAVSRPALPILLSINKNFGSVKLDCWYWNCISIIMNLDKFLGSV